MAQRLDVKSLGTPVNCLLDWIMDSNWQKSPLNAWASMSMDEGDCRLINAAHSSFNFLIVQWIEIWNFSIWARRDGTRILNLIEMRWSRNEPLASCDPESFLVTNHASTGTSPNCAMGLLPGWLLSRVGSLIVETVGSTFLANGRLAKKTGSGLCAFQRHSDCTGEDAYSHFIPLGDRKCWVS